MDKSSPEYQKYQQYLQSEQWRRKRAKKLRQARYKCQYCDKTGVSLQAHHLTYERLYRERMSDLAIACEDCHKIADEVRRFNKGLNTFMTRVYGDKWQDYFNDAEAAILFNRWLERKPE